MSNSLKLHEVEIKSKVKVIQVLPENKIRRIIMDMGIFKGTSIK